MCLRRAPTAGSISAYHAKRLPDGFSVHVAADLLDSFAHHQRGHANAVLHHLDPSRHVPERVYPCLAILGDDACSNVLLHICARESPRRRACERLSAAGRAGQRKERMEASRALAEAPDLVFNQECLELDHYARALLHRHLIDRVQRREKMGE